MSEILVYTLEDREGNETTEFETQDYEEAKTRALNENLRVICNEYEWSDSYMVDDFTSEPEAEANEEDTTLADEYTTYGEPLPGTR